MTKRWLLGILLLLAAAAMSCHPGDVRPRRVKEACRDANKVLLPTAVIVVSEQCREYFGEQRLRAPQAHKNPEVVLRDLSDLLRLARGCAGAEQQQTAYQRILLAFREALLHWYESHDQPERAAELLMKRHADWGEAFIETEAELRALGVSEVELGYRELPAARVRVDVLTQELLRATPESARQQALLCWYLDALPEEAQLWAAGLVRDKGLVEKVKKRIGRVTSYVNSITLAWLEDSARVTERVRDYLGWPYVAYLKAFEQTPLQRIYWEQPVVSDGGIVRDLPLKEIYDRVTNYDRQNVRALFEMYRAHHDWFAILDQGVVGQSPDIYERAARAADTLRRAYRLTEDHQRRLQEVAEIVKENQAQLPLVPGGRSTGQVVPPQQVLQRDIAVEFLRLALCLMNRAYLNDQGLDCPFPENDIPSGSCSARLEPRVAAAGRVAVVRDSYAKLLTALSLGSVKPLKVSTQCSLAAILDADLLGPSGMDLDLRAIRHGTALLGRLDIDVPKRQIGEWVSVAMQSAQRKLINSCPQGTSGTCAAVLLATGASFAPFCEDVIDVGYTLYNLAASPSAQRRSLLVRGGDFINSQVTTVGRYFRDEHAYCLNPKGAPSAGAATVDAGMNPPLDAGVQDAGEAEHVDAGGQPDLATRPPPPPTTTADWVTLGAHTYRRRNNLYVRWRRGQPGPVQVSSAQLRNEPLPRGYQLPSADEVARAYQADPRLGAQVLSAFCRRDNGDSGFLYFSELPRDGRALPARNGLCHALLARHIDRSVLLVG